VSDVSGPDVTAEIMAAIERLHGGEREAARATFEAIWTRLDPADAFHRCVLAHYMADAQDEPHDELAWDLRALEAASSASPEAFDDRFPGLTLASFFPSLHLNLAASCEAVGQLERAREHVAHASAAAHALGDGDLARTTRGAIERMLARLGRPA
jgi:hypothetical protein